MAAGAAVHDVLQWWARQMRALLPQGLLPDASHSDALLVAMAGTSDPPQINLSLRRRRRETPLGSFRLDEAGRHAAMAAICQRAGRVILRPNPAAVLERKLMLPLAAEHDVSRVLRYEMDRLTPFTAEQVFWSAIIERRDRAAGRLELHLSLLPKSLVQPVLAAIEAIGLKVSAIEPSSRGGPPRSIDLATGRNARSKHADQRLVHHRRLSRRDIRRQLMKQVGAALLVAAALAAVIALEVSYPPANDVTQSQAHPPTTVAPISSATADHTNPWVATALARPLFSPDRRPAANAVTVASGRTVPGLPRLAGILVGLFGRSARRAGAVSQLRARYGARTSTCPGSAIAMTVRLLLLLVLLGVLAGCEHAEQPAIPALSEPPGASSAAPPRINGDVGAPRASPPAEVSYGTPGEVTLPGSATTSEAGDISLDLADTDIREVATQILGNILKVNYTIDPAVHGTATLRTVRPLARTQLLPVLQSLLAQNGAALVQSSGLYRVVPAAQAAAALGSDGTAGTIIVPLRYAAAEDLAKVLQPYVGEGGKIVADPGHNALLIGGEPQARESLQGLVQAFDTDILARQSYALLPVNSGDVKDFASALQDAFRGQSGGALAGMVRVVPMSRINAVLVISPQPRYIDQARRVYSLIDRARQQTIRSWHVHYLQNSHAEDIAYVLQQAFTPNNVTAQPTNTQAGAQRMSNAVGGLGNGFGRGGGTGGSGGMQGGYSGGGFGGAGLAWWHWWHRRSERGHARWSDRCRATEPAGRTTDSGTE